ncbi:MAG TPA: tetratricopeptide repeat protein, partial [Planctomycetota bacterium]|nr:tetratricopeptide repeat protein [Planctomycetota bacterium]
MNPSPAAFRRAKILASLVPVLLLLAGFTTWSVFHWKKQYARLAREKRARAAALPLLERAREGLAQTERYLRLPEPDPEAIRERAEQAVEAATDALSRFPAEEGIGSEEGHRLRGRALELLYNFDEARADYEEAVRLHSESPARLALGVLSARELARARLANLKTARDPEEHLVERVVEPLRRFQVPRPEWNFEVDLESRALCTLLIAYAVGDYDKVPSAAGVVDGFDRTQWLAPYLDGAAAGARGEGEAALARLQEAVRRAPGVADPHAWMGRVLHRLGRRTEALAALGTALSLTPHFPEAYYARGLISFEDGRFGDARADFDACVKLRPSLAEAHLKLGIASLEHWNRSGRADPADLDRAVRALGAYVGLRPGDASGRLWRARALL